MTQKIISYYRSLPIIIILGFIFISIAVFAWQGPTANPPDNNVPAPLNVSSNGQTKFAGLMLNFGDNPAPNGLIVANGNVGIGTQTPSKKLDVFTTGSKDDGFIIRRKDSTISTGLSINMGNKNPWIDYVGGITFIPTTKYDNLGEWVFDESNPPKIALHLDYIGNVGIGTTNPRSKLEVNGGIIASSFLTLAPDQTTDPNNEIGWRIENVGGRFKILNRPYFINSLWTEKLTILSSASGRSNDGNVGIGITNPSARLHIVGNTDNDNILKLQRGGTTYTTSFRIGADRAFVMDHDGNDILKIKNGNIGIGIGTADPSAKLHVSGSVRFEGLSSGDNYPRVLVTDSSGNIGWANKSNISLPSGTSSQTLRHNGTNWIADSNLVNTGTNIGIGTTNPSAKLHVSGSVRFEGLSSGDNYPRVLVTDSNGYIGWTNKSNIAGDNYWTLNGSNLYPKNSSWAVGIGTTKPSATLHVSGSVRFDRLSYGDNYPYVLVTNSSGDIGWASKSNIGFPSGSLHQTLRYDGAYWVAASNLINNGTDIGIGVSSPDGRLHIKNDSDNILVLQRQGKDPSYFRILSSGAFELYSNNLFLTIKNANLGIDESNPSERLHVYGRVRASGFCIDNSCITSWPSSSGSTTIIYPSRLLCGFNKDGDSIVPDDASKQAGCSSYKDSSEANKNYILSCPKDYRVVSGGAWCDEGYLRESRPNGLYKPSNTNNTYDSWKVSCRKVQDLSLVLYNVGMNTTIPVVPDGATLLCEK